MARDIETRICSYRDEGMADSRYPVIPSIAGYIRANILEGHGKFVTASTAGWAGESFIRPLRSARSERGRVYILYD